MKTFLSIEIDEQKVRYLLVEDNSKGLAIKGAGVSTLQVGPSAPGALASFVKELASSQKLKISRLFLTVNRRDAVVHQFSLGQVSKADLEQIIPAEIEKIPSFIDNDFDYVYQQYENKTRNNVIFGAMTDGLLQYLIKEIQQTGIPCHEMEMAPLNLSGLLKAQEFKQGPQSVVILGNRLTHMFIFEEGQIRYLYSTSTGDDILGDSFACTNWGEELKRALRSYELETKQTVSKGWLVWDRDKSANFDSFLRQEVNLNVQPLKVLQEYFKDDINPIYVLAAVPLICHLNKIKPSFSLTHFLRSSQVPVQLTRMVAMAGVFILITGIAFGCVINHFYQIGRQASADTQDVQKQIADVQTQSADVLKQRDAYMAMRKQLLFQATYVQLLKKMSWSQALTAVASELPHELALTSFKVDETGVVTFDGEAFRMESIAKVLRTIETSSILDRGQFSYLTEEDVAKKKVFRFGILANIKTGDES